MAAEYLQDKQKSFLVFHREIEDYFDVCCQLLIQKDLIEESEKTAEEARVNCQKYKQKLEDEEMVADEEYSSFVVDVERYETILNGLLTQFAHLEELLGVVRGQVEAQAEEYGQEFKRERLPMIKLSERGHLRAAAYLERVIHRKLRMHQGCWAITQRVNQNKLDMAHFERSATNLRLPYCIVDSDASTKQPPPDQPLLPAPRDDIDPDPNLNWCPNTAEYEEVDSLTDLYAMIP